MAVWDTTPLRALGVAVVCVGVSVIAMAVLAQLTAQSSTYLTFFPAVVIASLWAGRGGTAATVALSIAAVWAPLLLSGAPFNVSDLSVRTGAFTIAALLIGYVSSILRTTLRKLDHALRINREEAEALVVGEERLSLAQDVAGFGVFDWDLETGSAYFSKGFLTNWGMAEAPPDREALIARIHPDDRDRVRAENDAALASGKPYLCEYRIIRDDGAVRWLSVRAEVLLRPDGSPRRTIGVNQDITERKAAALQLAESEARFRAMADSAPAPIWVTDAQGNIQFASEAMLEIAGLKREELLGKRWVQEMHPDDVERVLGERAAALEGRPQAYETEARYRDAHKRWRWFRTSSRPRFDEQGGFMGYVGIAFDVTELRENEAALRESEQRFRLMADSAAAPIWVTDTPGGIEFTNQAMLDFFGLEAGSLTGDAWQTRIHPDDLPEMDKIRLESRGRRVPYLFEARFCDARGQWRWMRAYSKPRFGPDGGFLGYVGIAFDVTEQRETATALEESEARFRLIAESAPVNLWMGDAEGACVYLNRAQREFWGLDENLTGFTWGSSLHPDDQETLWSVFGKAMAEHAPFRVEARYKRADGEWRILETDAQPRFGPDGAFLGMIGVNVDVTDARQAVASLKESEERFRLIADSAPVLMWVSRLDGVREFVNIAYCEFAGMPFEEARRLDWRERIHPDDIARVVREQQAGEASHQPFTLEARYRLGDDWRWLRSFSQPRLGPSGDQIGFIGVAFDVTDAKRAEHDLRRINDLLEERVEAALAEKEQAEAALLHAQKLEAVGRLTGGVAHDFNNLLTVVIGALDMMLKRPLDEAKRRKMAEAAMAAARRGERLTHQLLAFSRRQALRPEVCDVNALVRESEPLLRRAVGESVRFRARLGAEGAVRIDPAQFEAALLNLVVNARDATPDGGAVTVETALVDTVEGEAPELPAGRWLRVQVSDTGEGMAPEVIERAFEPFFTTKPVGKGTGLGLSQVYGFARQSGGGAAIESRPGEGAAISLYLPLAEAPAASAARKTSARPAPSAPLRVLLVEDDPEVGQIAEAMLKGQGHSVRRASEASQALSILRGRSRFDLLLSDVIMPGGMNGVELAREARALRPDLAVILTSGYAGDPVDAALEASSWPFLRKPYSEAELADLLAAVRPAQGEPV